MASLSPVGQPWHIPTVPQQEASADETQEAQPTQQQETLARVVTRTFEGPKGLLNLPRGLLEIIAGKLEPSDQKVLRLINRHLKTTTDTQIIREEQERLRQFLLNIAECVQNFKVPAIHLSGTLATVNQELITFRDETFIPAMIPVLLTMDDNSLYTLQLNLSPTFYRHTLPRGFNQISNSLYSFLVLLGRSENTRFEDAFRTLQDVGPGQLQRGVELAYHSADALQNPAERNELLRITTRWDLEAFVNKELGGSIVHWNLSKWYVRDPHTMIPAKLGLITATFERLREIIDNITDPNTRISCHRDMAADKAKIYQCGGLNEEFDGAFLDLRRLTHQDQEVRGANFTTDRGFIRDWIGTLSLVGLFDDAVALAKSQDREMLDDISYRKLQFVIEKLSNYFHVNKPQLTAEQWNIAIELAKEVNLLKKHSDGLRNQFLFIIQREFPPRAAKITDSELYARVFGAFSVFRGRSDGLL